jgi:hypothetical protein
VARFTTASVAPTVPIPGVHVARISKAKEKTSQNGNAMLVMSARFVGGEELSFVTTFVEKAAKLVTYFCRSAELELPKEDGVEVELRAEDVLGRYFYPVVELDGDGLEAVPKITRVLSRAEALARSPLLAKVRLESQCLCTLRPIGGASF